MFIVIAIILTQPEPDNFLCQGPARENLYFV
jgi:hypothetical protein